MRPHPAFSLLLLLSLAGCGVVPGSKPAERVARQAGSVPVSTARPEMRQCNAELGQTGSRFAPLPDKFYGAGCSTTNSVRLERVGGDHTEFSVTNLGAVACPLANSFAGWARYGVDRAAQQILGSPLQRIETMGSFACRNISGTRRRSQHAYGNAIDVSGFRLEDGRLIDVKTFWKTAGKEGVFLRQVHQGACDIFSVTLGPNYNAAHADHFHMDMGGGRICR